MKKILFHVSNLLFIPLFIGIVTILCQEWYEMKKEKEKAVLRIKAVKNVYDDFLFEICGRAPEYVSFQEEEDSALARERDLYYMALLHIQEELISVRKENEILPYLSEYTRNHLSKFALEVEQEIKKDPGKRTSEEIAEGLQKFMKQQNCFMLELDYLNGELEEEELKQQIDFRAHSLI